MHEIAIISMRIKAILLVMLAAEDLMLLVLFGKQLMVEIIGHQLE